MFLQRQTGTADAASLARVHATSFAATVGIAGTNQCRARLLSSSRIASTIAACWRGLAIDGGGQLILGNGEVTVTIWTDGNVLAPQVLNSTTSASDKQTHATGS